VSHSRRRLAQITVMAILAALAGCTEDVSTEKDLSASLVRAEQLSEGQWQQVDRGATEPAGGFCDVQQTVEGTAPAGEAVTVLVDGPLHARDTRLEYDEPAAAYDQLRLRLANCAQDPESVRLKVAVEPLRVPALPDVRSEGFRLRVPVAGTVLLLDLAVWQTGSLVGLTRLTHPQEEHRTDSRLDELVRVAQENSTSS
jgi:hypothetical protein